MPSSSIFAKLPKPLLLIFIVICIASLFIFDYYLDRRISLILFYIFPVYLSTWYFGKYYGLAISFICSTGWLIADILPIKGCNAIPFITFWNFAANTGIFVVATFTIDKLNSSRRNAKELTRTDPVTKAANRKNLLEAIEYELKRMNRYKRPFTIAYIGLDDFRQLCQSMGRTAGNNLLKDFVSTLVSNIRSSDLVARATRDEFAVLLPETNEDQAQAVIRKLFASLENMLHDKKSGVSFGVGVVTFIRAPATVTDILHKVIYMMHAAKRDGKNSMRFLVWKETSIVR